ncbi:MAG: hypothetical protein Q8R35_02015 [bacterium]|nr:hypothetical protein [bacterium]
MTTILNIAKRYAFRERSAATAVLALPRFPRVLTLPFSGRAWRGIAMGALVVAVLAVAAYVAAVNAILLAGEDMKQDRKVLSSLQQEHALLAAALAAQESPAWLEANARAQGMVEATGIHFLNSVGTVAFSPRY